MGSSLKHRWSIGNNYLAGGFLFLRGQSLKTVGSTPIGETLIVKFPTRAAPRAYKGAGRV